MWGRAQPVKTHRELMREEMGAGWEHLSQAATQAAYGLSGSLGSGGDRMRRMASRRVDTTITPLVAAYREGAADAVKAAEKARRSSSRSSLGLVVGLVAVAAAAAVIGTVMMRRHRNSGEFDPDHALESMVYEGRAKVDTGRSEMASQARDAASTAGDAAGKAADEAADELGSHRPGGGPSPSSMPGATPRGDLGKGPRA